MSDIPDHDVIAWIKLKLSEINTLSGYYHTLIEDNIITEDAQLRDSDDVIVFIDDTIQTFSQTARSGYAGDLSVELGLIVPAYTDNDGALDARASMRKLFADIRSVFYPYAVNFDATSDVPSGVAGVYFENREILLLAEGAKSLEGKFRLRIAIKQTIS